MAEYTKVCTLGEVSPGMAKKIEANGKTLALFNVDGKVYAIENTCAHQGGPLCEGTLEGKIVTCPWHAWKYDVTTGFSTMDESINVVSYNTKIEGEDIWVEV